jgi:DNA-3-methyladenine glycosylase
MSGMPRPEPPDALPRSFYARPTLKVARDLLGCVLVRRLPDGLLRGRIVETEAYVGEGDKACHARAGRTPRTDPLYGPPGLAYVYLTYGMHYMLNAVTEPEGSPAAVLIRAAEPLEGIERMKRAREVENERLLTAGPARLTQAFGIDLRQNRADLRGPELWIEPGAPPPRSRILTSARVGCHTAAPPWDEMPWRFYVAGNPHVTPGTPRGIPAPAPGRRRARKAPSPRKTRSGADNRHRG